MDTPNYLDIIKYVLRRYAELLAAEDSVKAHLVFDDEHQSYVVVEIGWREKKYIYQPVIHLELHNNKVWIQQDYTEVGVADELMEAGIPAQQIVLGFRHPKVRQHTGFAVA